MPRISHDQKQYYKARIRDLLAQDHQRTQRAIQERLKEDGLDLDRTYLAPLLKAIYAERTKRADTMMLNHALAAFEDTMTEVVRDAWSIANERSARKQDRVMALREIREAHKDVFEKLFDAGVFERKLGTLDATIRNTPLAPERKQAIRSVFENRGLLEAPKEDVPPTDAPTA
jgi:arginine repressor